MKYNMLPILLAGTFLSTSAMAITLEPTLEDSVISYSEGTASNYNFTVQEADANGNLTTKYYKIDINKDKLSTSSNISWTALDSKPDDMTNVVEITLPNNQTKYFKYTYTRSNTTSAPSLEPTLADSAISYSEGTASDYNFAVSEVDSSGNLIKKYYKINIDKDKLSTSSSISWSEVTSSGTNTIEVKLPSGQIKYYKYTYHKPNGYTETSIRINDTLATSDVTDVVFSGISSSSNGGAIHNHDKDNSSISIKADFIGNSVTSTNYANVYGGAIYNGYNRGSIGDITGDFIGNYATSSGSYAFGGAIFNGGVIGNNGTIGNITGDFIGNYASGSYVRGGAIYNESVLGDIKGDFIGNYASGSYDNLRGGAIYNAYGSIGDITGDFIGNYATSSGGYTEGGAIYNYCGTIGDITGDFIGNYATSSGSYHEVYGGAIYNYYGTIGDITGDFIGNYATSSGSYVYGGAIYNSGSIGDITGDFIGNYATSSGSYVFGGAISNRGVLGDITGDFIGNYATSSGSYVFGGAISNRGVLGDIKGGLNKKLDKSAATIGNITGDFIGNYAEGKYMALGGALYTNGNTEYVYDDGSSDIYEVGTISGSFINNYIKVTDEIGIALGGAIFVDGGELTFKSDGITNRFSGNYVEDSSGITNNAIWVNTNKYNLEDYGIRGALNFEVTNGGGYVFDDEIDGGFVNYTNDGPTIIRDGYGYNVNIYGDVCPQCIVNSVIFNSKVKNVYDLTLDTTQMVLGKNAHIEIVNDYIAQNNPYLRLNVDAVNGKTGQLEIGGQVIGTTQVIANIVNYKDVRGEESIVFATAENDTTGGEDSFKIFRTVGSPYKWYVDYDESAKTWGLAMGEEANDYEEDCYPETEPEPEPEPNPVQPLGPIQVEPEIIGFEALQSAGLSQTNGMVYNIMRKVGVNRLYCPGCGFYDYNWDGEAFHNVWVDTTYNGLTIEAPVEIEAKVWGIEAGADVQHDLNNKLGIFVSYRQGNYEMDGKGEKYYSKVGSELDIDSYLAGLYYRYDNNNWYAFATLYGGMQNAEIKTDDGVSADTDGIEFGGSAEIGYSHALNKTVYITPSLGVFYSQISYDDASDDYGKTVEYGDLKQVELEAGLKLSKAVYTDNGTASIYVKPSVVQTLIDGDEINITEIGKVDTIEDKTLGRIEIGGSYGFNDNWSAYGWANYTFGSDYEATSLGAGINYAW